MTQAITHIKPLSVIRCSNDTNIFVEMTLEQLDKKMENSYMILDDGTRLSTARNLIRSYGNATPVEYYTHFIVPTLPHSVKSRMEDLFNRLPEERKKTVSLEAILEKQKYFENNL